MEHTKLFGTDGIRGVAGVYPLDGDTVRTIGAAAATVLRAAARASSDAKPVVLIGRDTRESGAEISGRLAEGFAAAGIDVWDLGVIPTPGVAYLVEHNPVLAGVVISASHNPYQDNGIKFFGHEGTKLPDAVEEKIENEIRSPGSSFAAGTGRVIPRESLVKKYEEFLFGSFPSGVDLRGMRVLIDCANGATCAVASSLFSSLGADAAIVNAGPDGRNINADCGSLHPEKLAHEVLARKASCGLAFDGDGDRFICVDETGEIRDGDYLLSLSALHGKKKGTLANDTLVTTVMANLGLFRAMEREGVTVLQTSVGDRYVFEEMVRSGAVLGGEQSGHIIFRDFLNTGDGMMSALQTLAVMRETGKPLSELCSVMQKYPQVLLNTKVSRKVPLASLPLTSKAIKDLEAKLKSDGRILVRYSGTENLLRIMVEGRDKSDISVMANDISDIAKREIDAVV